MIKNELTEKFCKEVAELYNRNQEQAKQKFVKFVENNRLVRWETIALNERIFQIVKEMK